MPSPNEPSSAVRAEQPVVAAMYDRLDELTTKAARDLNRAKRSPTAGTPAAQVEREAMIRVYTERVGALVSAERRLCFGRLDFSAGGTPVYIGRLSLADEAQNLLLTDWRAPAAEPFYRATTATPMGVARRRHILLDGREVSGVEDDVLDLDAVGADSSYEGNGALMAALAARRTGRMGDIVATIQAEQDRIIRAPMPGILVVEGGPGCGKTVVGLHRAAYLLYTHRDQIARSGVLVVGPNPLFLRYISQVLPGLGESSAVLATPGQLYPAVEAEPEVSDSVAVIKGDLRMAEVVASCDPQPPAGPGLGQAAHRRGDPDHPHPGDGRRCPRSCARLSQAAQPRAPDVRHLAARSARAGAGGGAGRGPGLQSGDPPGRPARQPGRAPRGEPVLDAAHPGAGHHRAVGEPAGAGRSRPEAVAPGA